jgi:hypothetical protein
VTSKSMVLFTSLVFVMLTMIESMYGQWSHLKGALTEKAEVGKQIFSRKSQILKFLLYSPKNPLFRGGLLPLN